jgi:hypothetical protein
MSILRLLAATTQSYIRKTRTCHRKDGHSILYFRISLFAWYLISKNLSQIQKVQTENKFKEAKFVNACLAPNP